MFYGIEEHITTIHSGYFFTQNKKNAFEQVECKIVIDMDLCERPVYAL